ncbi:putative inactive carboxylesterase 4 isoform X3 [Oratosquilla oratoria]|uniref:putative inactive carboxylesterase 4 isoform X3 n=1 Tax=Oratosquilla oratoria TaxID=337810 RepID=UPI003F76DA29
MQVVSRKDNKSIYLQTLVMFATVALVVALVVSEAVTHVSATQEGRVVLEIIQGRLSGVREESMKGRPFYAFRNIPYAKPPLGPLRFKDPEPAVGWDGIRDASSYPPRCIQQPLVDCMDSQYFVSGQEDCLYLNVYTPKVSVRSQLPVMVFIHGGGFQSGETYSYPPHVLLDRDVVLVVLQYRVGPFGFLSTEDSVIPGNFGLKDQTLALRWVQQNIGFFGGDPDRVTIFGQSAGGASVHYQMLIPEAKGLFSRAILQSGSALNGWAREDNLRDLAMNLAKAVRCPLDQGSQDLLECLQEISATTLTSHYTNMTMYTDSVMNVGIDVSSELHSRYHPVFIYEFRHKGENSVADQIGGTFAKKWVIHFDDLVYFFEGGEFGTLDDATDLAVRDIMVTLWTNFAATGDPTPDDSLWFKWEASRRSPLSRLVIESQPFMEKNSRKERMDFWLGLAAQKVLVEALERKTKDEL